MGVDECLGLKAHVIASYNTNQKGLMCFIYFSTKRDLGLVIVLLIIIYTNFLV